jgi:hypothetical protein
MESYEKRSDEAAADADRLAEEGERVDRHIEEAKRDWEAKQSDSGVPGAVPEPDEDQDEDRPAEAQSERGEAADSAGQ